MHLSTRPARPSPRWTPLALLAFALARCGGSEDATPNPGTARDAGADAPAASALPALRLVVDGDRNGALDDTAAEYALRGRFSTTSGAMLLANVDDDDSDHTVDATDTRVNGEADEADLARIRIPAWSAAPMGAAATLSVDGESASRVRLFRHTGSTWTAVEGTAQLDTAALREGAEFGIEAKDFPAASWDGTVTLTLAATNAGAITGDVAVMRTAPWMIFNSLDTTLRIYGPQAANYPPAVAFAGDLEFYAEQDGMPVTMIDTEDRAYLPNPDEEGPDVWMQDIMELGWTGIPGPGGMHAMPVVLRTPNGTRPVATYTQREMLGPDFGYVWKRATNSANGTRWDVSLDSFGNLELIPPHRTATRDYPLGRILRGEVEARHGDVALKSFLEAQSVQGPPLYVDTSWLYVGHVDEYVSFIPADTPRGWKLLLASPRLARAQLTAFASQRPSNRSAMMFAGRYFYYETGPMIGRPYPAQRTVGAILGDEELMAFNQMVQGHLDTLRETLQTETGLTDDEIVEVPFLMSPHENQRAAAYQPGTVNLLFYGRTAIVARPYGPSDGVNDIVETDMNERLAPFGITVRFAEQWDLLHAADGEVHCGTNALRAFPERRWWEVAR